jgi:hypothetical protein
VTLTSRYLDLVEANRQREEARQKNKRMHRLGLAGLLTLGAIAIKAKKG